MKYFIIVLAAITLLTSCKKDRPEPAKPAPFESYLLIDNKHYSLTDGYLSFDERHQKFTSTIWLTNATENTGFSIDFLIVNDTTALPSGNYQFKKVTSTKDMEAGKFHTVAFQYREGSLTKQISSFNNEITSANIQVGKQNKIERIDAMVEYQGKTVKVHFEGVLHRLKYW